MQNKLKYFLVLSQPHVYLQDKLPRCRSRVRKRGEEGGETICEEAATIHITKPVIRAERGERGRERCSRGATVRPSLWPDIPRLRVTLNAAEYGDGIMNPLMKLLSHRFL